MATHNKPGKAVSNNTGAIKSKGDLTNLVGVSVGNIPTETNAGNFGAAQFVSDTYQLNGLPIGNVDNTAYNNQLTFNSHESLNIDYVTGQPSGIRTSTDTFVINSDLRANDFAKYQVLIGGRTRKFDYVTETPLYAYGLMGNTGTIKITPTKKAVTFFGGVVSPTGATNYTNSVSVSEYDFNGGLLSTTSYDIDAYTTLDLNYLNSDVYTVSYSGVVAGSRDKFIQATTVTRTVSVSPYAVSPATMGSPAANVTLSSERAVRFTPSDDLILFWKYIDNNGNYSPVCFDIIPSGLQKTLYMTYDKVAFGSIGSTTINMEIMS